LAGFQDFEIRSNARLFSIFRGLLRSVSAWLDSGTRQNVRGVIPRAKLLFLRRCQTQDFLAVA